MTDIRVLSNKRVAVYLGPDTAIADYDHPTLAELQSLTNVSEAVKWDGFDFNLEASDQQDDRSLTDEAGAQDRSYDQFGGSIAFFTPKQTDQTSILRTVRNIVAKPHTKLAVVVRVITLNSVGLATGDEINAYRTITDATRHERSEASMYYTVNFRPQDDMVSNYVVPSSTAAAPVITTDTAAIDVDGIAFAKAVYEGVNVTIGTEWTSSDSAVAEVTPHGIVIGKSAGTAEITGTVPGAAEATAVEVTVA